MALPHRLVWRQLVYGYGNGQLYGTAASDGNITVSSTHHRGSGFALRVDGQSGVNSNFAPPNIGAVTRAFTRKYFWFVSIPSASRIFWAGSAASPTGAQTINLRMKSDGHIEIRQATTVLGTSASAFTTGRFYQIEVGHDTNAQVVSLKVDGSFEIDWVATTSTACFCGQGIGVIDTVAAAFEFYATDCVTDIRDFPGYGKTKVLKCASLASDNANWVNTGGAASKMDAVDPNLAGAGYNDATYLLSSTNNAEIGFYLDTMPANCVAVYGVAIWRRYIRNGGTNATATPSIGMVDQSVYTSVSSGAIDQAASTATRKTDFGSVMTSVSRVGPQWPSEFWGAFTVGMVTRDVNGFQLSALWAEVDYSDLGGERLPEWPIVLCDFESSTVDAEFNDTNSSVGAGITTDPAQSKFGAQALKVVHPSGSHTAIRTVMGVFFGDYSTLFTPKMQTLATWCKITTAQSSGDLGLVYWVANTTTRIQIITDATGALKVNIDGSVSSATAAGVVPANTWFHIGVEVYLGPSAATNSRVRVYIDGVLVKTHTATCATLAMDSTWFAHLGSIANVTGGATVWYDGFIVDLTSLHTPHFKFATLTPTAVGTSTVAGFTANGAANKWDCVDELPDDGDTTYVFMATGLGTTSHESWTMADLAAEALHCTNLFVHYAVHKRDAAANGNWGNGELAVRNGNTIVQRSSNIASGAAYATHIRRVRTHIPLGLLTPSIIATIEPDARQESNTVATRITLEAMVFGYTAHNDYPVDPLLPIQGIG